MTENITIECIGDSPSYGTVVKIGDVLLPNLTNVEFRHKARELAEVKVDMVALGDFSITLPADVKVSINVNVMPGYTLLKVHKPDGSISYRCVEEVQS